MPRPFKFRLKDKDGETPEIQGEFSDEEWELLQRYARFFDEFADTDLCKRGLDYGISIAWSADGGWAPVDTSRLPPKKDLREFLHAFRPILLEGEPTYFMKVLSIISKQAPHRGWRMLRDEFDGRRFEQMFTISVTPACSALNPDPQRVVLNSARTLKKWLNAFEYHRDADLAAEFAEVHADDFPTPDDIKGLMLEILREKTLAALKLREIIRTFNQGPGSSTTIK